MDKPKAILSPNEAAQIIGCKPDTVRDRMYFGDWDIGQVIKPTGKNGRKNYRYEISRAKLYKMLGINEEEEK